MKVGFVIPWFGPEISGETESLCRSTALRLSKAGAQVEILTTCVKDAASDWSEDFHKSGLDDYHGIPVRRFGVRRRDTAAYERIDQRIRADLKVLDEHERIFLRESLRSNDLLAFMKQHRSEYVYAHLPYWSGTTFHGVTACPERSIVIPCLQDENHAYLGRFRGMCTSARGLIFNTKHERDLALELYGLPPENAVIAGRGVDTNFVRDGQRFKAKHGLGRYLVFSGGRGRDKNVRLLVDYFTRFKRFYDGELQLVLIDEASASIPPEHLGKDVFNLGLVPAQDRYDAYAGAVALCQPSPLDGHSVVLMESWIAGAPVLVHEECEVSRAHCVSSGGGLYFSGFDDFAGALRFLTEQPARALRMAENGAQYVRANYAWERVTAKYLEALKSWGFAD